MAKSVFTVLGHAVIRSVFVSTDWMRAFIGILAKTNQCFHGHHYLYNTVTVNVPVSVCQSSMGISQQ